MIFSLLYSSTTPAKAASFLASGVSRLLGYEVEGGGYSWFGSKPANEPLTAYGLLEFQELLRLPGGARAAGGDAGEPAARGGDAHDEVAAGEGG